MLFAQPGGPKVRGNQILSGVYRANIGMDRGQANMDVFTRDNGQSLAVIEGFRDMVLSNRPAKSPRPEWTEEYSSAADARLMIWENRLKEL